jgi:outer membrane lipoprotein-sorting protein
MRPVKILMIALVASLSVSAVCAQTADEIINKYFENTGGKAKWEAVQGVKMTAKVSAQGMEIPIIIIQLKDGRQSTSYTFQGMEFREGVYDGTNHWGTNQMTMKAEKSDAEATENFKTTLLDFPDPFLNYSSKGYKVELLGKETVEGSETFKIKLTKKPIKVDGKETESVSFYYFDTENYVPLLIETEVKSGPSKGIISQVKMSDYQEVNGLMFPFSMSQGSKGQPGGQAITLTAIELDPKIDQALFAFPAGN